MRSSEKWSIANAAAMKRARCIGEGRAKARARNARWVSWLKKHWACRPAVEHAERSVSPEHAVSTAYRSWLCWLSENVLGFTDGDGCPSCSSPSDVAVATILRSPEWAALPWQREAP